VSGDMQRSLWKLPSSVTEDALGTLPLFSGMKVMIRENIAFSKRLVNGAEGIVRNVLYESVNGVTHPTVAYVVVPGAGKICDNLEEDLVPVFTEITRFKATFSVNGKKIVKSVARQQLPLIPAYAYTDYKSQGKSLTYAILDL
ncbi:hypothetical protein OH77DRAFT_1384230, partial [Trametes cingulata]